MINFHLRIRNLKNNPSTLRGRFHVQIANLPLAIADTKEFGGREQNAKED